MLKWYVKKVVLIVVVLIMLDIMTLKQSFSVKSVEKWRMIKMTEFDMMVMLGYIKDKHPDIYEEAKRTL